MDTTPQKYHRGDIYYANLEPHLGCEQGGIRHRAGRQADGSTLIAQLLLEQQLHAIALQEISIPKRLLCRP